MAVIIPIETKYNPRGVRTAIRDLDDFKAAVEKAGGGFSGFAKVTGETMKAVGRNITSTGKDLTLGVTLPLVGIGVAAVASQAKFETSMNSLQVNSGASAKQMESLSALALQMGADTVFSAGEAADAMLELSKGGLAAADIQGGALASTMALAATEGMDLARAAEIVSQGMNTFGLEASQTAQIADLLAAGAVASTAGVEDLAGGLKYVGVTANQFGIGLNDTVTALAAMNNAGIDATTAGTSLNRFFLGLAGTTKKGAATMKEYGLRFFDAQGQMRPMTDIIAELDKNLGGLTDKERTQVMKDLFGVEGMRAANVLLQQGADGYENLAGAVNKQGVAQELADARMSGTAGALEQLKGSLETAAISIGQVLAPMIQKVAGFIQGLVDKFQTLSPGVKQFITIAGIAAAALGPVLVVVGLLVTALGSMMTVIGGITAAGGLAAIGSAAAAIAGPILAVVAVIGALVAAVIAVWNNSEAFRNAVISVWNTIKAAIQAAVDTIRQKLDQNRDKIETLQKAFSAVAKFVGDTLAPILSVVLGTALKVLITGIGNAIGVVIDIIGAVVDFGGALIEGGKQVVEFAKGVGRAIGDAIDFFAQLPKKVIGLFSNAGTWLVDTGKNIIRGLIDGAGSLLRNMGQFFLDLVPDWIEGPFKAALGISSPSKVFFGFGKNVIQGFVNGVSSGKPEVEQAARDSFADALNKTVSQQIDLLKQKLETAKQEFTSFKDSVVSSITQAFSFGEAYEAAKASGITFLEALTSQAEQATTFADRIKTLVMMGLSKEAIQQVLAAGATAGTAIANDLIAGGATTIKETNELVQTTQDAADEVGLLAATNFFGAGRKTAQDTLAGFKEQFGKGGPGRKELMGVMDSLAADAKRAVQIDVSVTKNITEIVTKIPGKAAGGPVTAGKPYIVGEIGPELFVPRVSGTIVPNNQLGRGGVTVAPGAVQVVVNGGQGEDVQSAVDAAFDRLVRELQAL